MYLYMFCFAYGNSKNARTEVQCGCILRTRAISVGVNSCEAKVECVVSSGGCGLEMTPPTV